MTAHPFLHESHLIGLGHIGSDRVILILSRDSVSLDFIDGAASLLRLPLGDADFPQIGVLGVSDDHLMRYSSEGIWFCGGYDAQGQRIVVSGTEGFMHNTVSAYLSKTVDVETFDRIFAGAIALRDVFTRGTNQVILVAPGNQRFAYNLAAEETPMKWLPLDRETFISLRSGREDV